MPYQKTLESEIIRWARVISFVGLVGLIIFSAITVGDVLIRWLTDISMLGVADISQLVIAITIASCFPLVFAEKRSITVRLVGSQLGPRGHALLEAFGTFVSLAILALLAWQFWGYTSELAAVNEVTWHLRLAKAPWYMIVSILMSLCVPILVVLFINQVKSFFLIEKNVSQQAEFDPGNHQEEEGP